MRNRRSPAPTQRPVNADQRRRSVGLRLCQLRPSCALGAAVSRRSASPAFGQCRMIARAVEGCTPFAMLLIAACVRPVWAVGLFDARKDSSAGHRGTEWAEGACTSLNQGRRSARHGRPPCRALRRRAASPKQPLFCAQPRNWLPGVAYLSEWRGRTIVKMHPVPGTSRTLRVPPSASTLFRAIDRPSPMPVRSSLC